MAIYTVRCYSRSVFIIPFTDSVMGTKNFTRAYLLRKQVKKGVQNKHSLLAQHNAVFVRMEVGSELMRCASSVLKPKEMALIYRHESTTKKMFAQKRQRRLGRDRSAGTITYAITADRRLLCVSMVGL